MDAQLVLLLDARKDSLVGKHLCQRWAPSMNPSWLLLLCNKGIKKLIILKEFIITKYTLYKKRMQYIQMERKISHKYIFIEIIDVQVIATIITILYLLFNKLSFTNRSKLS